MSEIVKVDVGAMAQYKEELARIAKQTQVQEEGVGYPFLKVGVGGIMSLNGATIPNNQMAVVVLDSVIERVYYRGIYDSDNPTAPTCFAFGRKDSEMRPHEKCFDAGTAQNPTCVGCRHDEYGTAAVGKGKACKQVRRVCMIQAGKFNSNGVYEPIDDPAYFQVAQPFFYRVPVTSVKAFSGWVTQVTSGTGLEGGVPTFAVLARIASFPDPKNQLRVVFSTVQRVPDDLLPTLLGRYREVESKIMFPYQVLGAEEQTAPEEEKKRKFNR